MNLRTLKYFVAIANAAYDMTRNVTVQESKVVNFGRHDRRKSMIFVRSQFSTG